MRHHTHGCHNVGTISYYLNTFLRIVQLTDVCLVSFHLFPLQIWVRNYQILEEAPTNAKEAREERRSTGSDRATNLVEIGPRFVLNPIRIFRGAFGGQTLYQNSEYVNPNVLRAQMRREKGRAYEVRKGAERMRKKRKEELVVPADPLTDVFS